MSQFDDDLFGDPTSEPLAPATHSCVGCGRTTPNGHSEYTLISAAYGWRLARRPEPDGGYAFDWRCPSCWKKHRAKKAG